MLTRHLYNSSPKRVVWINPRLKGWSRKLQSRSDMKLCVRRILHSDRPRIGSTLPLYGGAPWHHRTQGSKWIFHWLRYTNIAGPVKSTACSEQLGSKSIQQLIGAASLLALHWANKLSSQQLGSKISTLLQLTMTPSILIIYQWCFNLLADKSFKTMRIRHNQERLSKVRSIIENMIFTNSSSRE